MKQLLKEICSNYKGIFFLTFFVALLYAGADIGNGIIQKHILDTLVLSQNFQKIVLLIIGLFFMYGINQVFGALTYYLSNKYGELVYKDYKQKALEKFNRIKFNIIVDKKQGEISEIISKGTTALSALVETFFSSIVQNILLISFGLTILYYIDTYIFLFFTCIFIPSFVSYSIYKIRTLIPDDKELNREENRLSGSLVEYLSNIRDIKIFGAQKTFTQVFSGKLGSLFSLDMSIERKKHYMNFMQFILLIGSMCLILTYTAYNIMQGLYSVGIFILVFHIFNSIRFALWNLVFHYRSFQENIIKVEKLLDFFEYEESGNFEREVIKDFNSLELSKLSFGFDEKNLTLDKINFKINSGEKIAIIGKSGQGKTTLINIILGLYEGYAGDISINSKKVTGNIGELFSYVPQDVQLFNEDIRFNLTLGERFDDTHLIRMLSNVGLGYLGERAEKGKTILDIMVGSDGLKLSGGERQRLGIARSLVRDKEIYVFDEITSNLDEDTEREIIGLLFHIASTKTFIIISHRKQILKNVDRIYEMKHGNLTIIK